MQPQNFQTGSQGLFDRTVCFLLAGGVGSRLAPLTEERAKPAVPFAGKYRIIDFTLANCLNSNLRQVYVLTQYKSQSLQRHLRDGWSIYNPELDEFITPVPPQMRTGESWYKGTADAIFQNLYLLDRADADRVIVLSGDHIYRMDYAAMMDFHLQRKADLTVACLQVPVAQGSEFGLMNVDEDYRIQSFDEKPASPQENPSTPGHVLASMGIYIFEADRLQEVLRSDHGEDNSKHDFGRDIIPHLLETGEVFAYPFSQSGGRVSPDRYWRDVGTIDAYFDAHMDLLKPMPPLDLYQTEWPIRTYQSQKPPARVVPGPSLDGCVSNSILGSGSLICGGRVHQSILSSSVRVEEGAVVDECVLFDDVTIGPGAKMRRCIIDKGVHVPAGVHIGYDVEHDTSRFSRSDAGVVVVPKGYEFSNQPEAVPV